MSNAFFSSEKPKRAHLVTGKSGVAGEVDDLRGDVDRGFDAVETALSGLGAAPNYQRTLHVGKHGDDTANNGLNPDNAFLTIGKATTEAAALTPTVDNPVVIKAVDFAKYEENVVLPAHVHLSGGCEIAPTSGVALQCNPGCIVDIREVTAVASQNGIERLDVAGDPVILNLKVHRASTGGGGIVNLETATGAAMLVDVKEVFCVEGSLGFGALATTFGHMHVKVGDIYFQNDNAVGVLLSLGGSIVGNIDHIVDISGSGTNNKGFLVNAGNVDVDVQYINADIAYEVGGGDLNLKVNRIVGNRVITSGLARTVVPPWVAAGDPGINNDGVDTAAAGQAFDVGDVWINTSAGGKVWRCISAATGAAVWLQTA